MRWMGTSLWPEPLIEKRLPITRWVLRAITSLPLCWYCVFSECVLAPERSAVKLETQLQLLSCKISRRTIGNGKCVCFSHNWNVSSFCVEFLSFFFSGNAVWTLCTHLISEQKILFGQRKIFWGSCHYGTTELYNFIVKW